MGLKASANRRKDAIKRRLMMDGKEKKPGAVFMIFCTSILLMPSSSRLEDRTKETQFLIGCK